MVERADMGCSYTGRIQRLISGELGAKSTRNALDHMRGCDPCRAAVESAGETAPTAARGPGEVPYQRYTVEEVEVARNTVNPGRRRGMFALIMVVLLTTVAIVSAEAENGPENTDADAACREALAEGRPWAVSPFGEGPLPRQIRGVLPPGSRGFRVRISTQGQALWEAGFRAGQPGVEIYETVGGEGDEEYAAVAAIAPFPGIADLALKPDMEYELRVVTEDGAGVSDGIAFSVVR